jgi:hypothetical protein
LCSYGWHQSLGIIMSVYVGFLYISNSIELYWNNVHRQTNMKRMAYTKWSAWAAQWST